MQVHGLGAVKDTHAQPADAATTLGVYTQKIPDPVRKHVEELDEKLFEQRPIRTAAVAWFRRFFRRPCKCRPLTKSISAECSGFPAQTLAQGGTRAPSKSSL